MRLPLSTVDPALYHSRAPVPSDRAVLRYLGTAGFVLEAQQHTLVIDPFVTRTGLWDTVFSRLEPDEARIRALIPRADDVLVGHAHYDHVLDAPALCRHTGARLIGSPAVAMCGRAAGLPESQIRVTEGGEEIASGPGMVKGLPSKHGRVYFNRVSLPGDILSPPSWPPRLRELRHGLVLNWLVELGGLRLVHIDSADFLDEQLASVGPVDVLCLCAIGRAWRPRYVEDAVRFLRPRLVVACHWDLFATPFEQAPYLLPGVDLPGFVEEIRRAGSEPVVLPLGGRLGLA